LERVTKYYVAINVGFDTPTNKDQIKKSMNSIEESLMAISLYNYPKEMKVMQRNLDESWSHNRVFLKNSDEIFIPKLMFMSIMNMEDIISKISIYHSKNQ
ncbi:MAG: hypothetical protein KAI79_09995, partial [Bacteroidales bacterium]|nr:hypothetical protein [Bacteroidales bacterium]